MSQIKRTNTFSFEHRSEVEQKVYEGKFTSRIATFVDKAKIATRASQLCGGMYCVRDDDGVPTGRGIDETTEMNARMIAWLETVLVQQPEWFVLNDPERGVVDEDLIFALFKEVMSYERRFRGGERATAEGAGGRAEGGEGTGASQHQKANAGGSASQVVGREVQASLDP